MTKFRLRAWVQQVLSDRLDYLVEAETAEEAAKRLRCALDASAAAHELSYGSDSLTRLGYDGEADETLLIRQPEPEEISDGESGIEEIGADGDTIREVENPNEIGTRLEIALSALREIREGSSVTGRWLSDDTQEEVGQEESAPDSGYYDRDAPPPGYGCDGWVGLPGDEVAPPAPLKPAEWAPYTDEEQEMWIGSAFSIADRALRAAGSEDVKRDQSGDF